MNNIAVWAMALILVLLVSAVEIYRETHHFRVRKYGIETEKILEKQNRVKLIFLSRRTVDLFRLL